MVDEIKPLKPRKMTFLFARMFYTDLFGKQHKAKLYSNMVKSQDVQKREKRVYWAFGDIGKVDVENTEIIYGRLGNTPIEKIKKSYDKQKHSYNGLTEDKASDWSNFWIVPGETVKCCG